MTFEADSDAPADFAAAIPPEFSAFLAEPRNAILSVARAEGRPPHATPVWFVYSDGIFRISITRNRVKFRLVERRPQVSLVVDDATGFRTLMVEGSATFSDGDTDLVLLAKELRAKHRPGAPTASDIEILRGLRAEGRVVLTVTPGRVLSWSR
ncbi:MAG: hypothetical protein GEU80_10695 [Dehalococcoidia bacterium]|nr:hypothetical protein [Dehalococcoidia bacterium]